MNVCEPKRGCRGRKAQPNSFVPNLYKILSDSGAAGLIEWDASGAFFKVSQPSEVGPVFKKYYKHDNWASFVRQLNTYGFWKKGKNEGYEIGHNFFLRGRPELLEKIVRRAGPRERRSRAKDTDADALWSSPSTSPNFVSSLHHLLTDQKQNLLGRAEWHSSGAYFRVINAHALSTILASLELAPDFSSFMTKLRELGFWTHLNNGCYETGHEKFHRDHPQLLQGIQLHHTSMQKTQLVKREHSMRQQNHSAKRPRPSSSVNSRMGTNGSTIPIHSKLGGTSLPCAAAAPSSTFAVAPSPAFPATGMPTSSVTTAATTNALDVFAATAADVFAAAAQHNLPATTSVSDSYTGDDAHSVSVGLVYCKPSERRSHSQRDGHRGAKVVVHGSPSTSAAPNLQHQSMTLSQSQNKVISAQSSPSSLSVECDIDTHGVAKRVKVVTPPPVFNGDSFGGVGRKVQALEQRMLQLEKDLEVKSEIIEALVNRVMTLEKGKTNKIGSTASSSAPAPASVLACT